MSLIKQTIKFNNLDANLTISLGSSNGLIGQQQVLDNLVNETKEILINPVVDTETRRFVYRTDLGNTNLLFYFGASQLNTFENTNFTSSEMKINNPQILNSFFTLDFYDSFDNNTQTKIFSSYLTKIFGINDTNPSNQYKPFYRLYNDIQNQFYSWNVPQSFIDSQTGSTAIGYVRFSFYNAKTGKFKIFYNNDNESLTTNEKLYFKAILYLESNTFAFILPNPPNVKAYELVNSAYVNRINNGVSNFNDKKQAYPSGNTFQYGDGTYIKL